MPTIQSHPTRPGVYVLNDELWLPRGIEDVFQFFADAHRLEDLTPGWLHFHVITPKPVAMFPGAKIDYRLRMRGVPLRWQSEISVWEPPLRFVDRQTVGPYRLWHHDHTFVEQDGGTLVRDVVDYSVPGGWLVNTLFVKRDLERIFAFRHQKLREFFDTPSGDQNSITSPSSALSPS